MKKSLIALMIASVVTLTACDDKTSQQLLETEKKLVQLEATYKKSVDELSAKEAELAQAQAELTTLREKTAKYTEQTFPALKVESVKLFDQEETIKFPKDPENEYSPEQGNLSLSIESAKTNIDWLDNLLFKELLLSYLPADQKENINRELITEEKAHAYFDKLYQVDKKTMTEDKYTAYTNNASTHYIGQRHNIVMFSQSFDSYTGGAHGSYYTTYLNIDINKKTVIQLDDLISKKNQNKLKNILWESYARERLDESGNFDESFISKKDFYISKNFYFSPTGITFVYPIYTLGPYAEGEISLSVSDYEINELINQAYSPFKKRVEM